MKEDRSALDDYLSGIAVVSQNDVWAVGAAQLTLSDTDSIIEHWDGSRWRGSVGQVSQVSGGLNAAYAASAGDVWAVGDSVQHWDGKRWKLVMRFGAGFNGIAGTSRWDIWAVGARVEHWNGRNWRAVPSPNTTRGFSLYGVAAISPTDVWAVGAAPTTHPPAGPAFIEHYSC